MDIMNNMTVSTSKLTFSLIALTALLVSGSAFANQEAFAFGEGIEPTFTAYHNTTTMTVVTFDGFVNGTLINADWRITADGTSVRPFTDSVTITGITNSSSHPVAGHGSNSLAADAVSKLINHTVGPIYIHHSAINSGVTFNINFTNSETASGVVHLNGTTGLGFVADIIRGDNGRNEVFMATGTDAVAIDYMVPTAVSAEILKSNPDQVRILMSETIANINSTYPLFTLTTEFGSNGVENRDAKASGLLGQNSTKYIYVDLQNAAKEGDVFTIAYTGGSTWITDGISTDRYGVGAGDNTAGVGNRMVDFSGLSIVNYVNPHGLIGNLDNCYDCSAPVVTKVQVSLDSSVPITITDNNPVQINAGLGDSVSIMVTVADNVGAASIPFAGLYTNFGETPDNLYYANNFDSAKQMSTSYYEWNVRTDNVAFDNNGAITWSDATTKINSDTTKTFTYTLTVNDSIESSQVWVDIGDKVGNYAKLALPITLEVSGAPAITFASDDSQKVVSFFNESILLAIVSQWTTTSSDDASNVEQLSSVLGIENQLPTWTTDLASWVADDKIDVADMIVAVEYVINQ